MNHADPILLEKNLRYLTDTIGVRLAGSDGERKAAEYLRNEFLKYSSRVTIEEFPVNERYVTDEKLEIMIGGEWKTFPCSLFGSAPSTDGKTVESEIVWFDTATGYMRKDLSFLTGKAVIHLGCHIESGECYRRLMEAKPAFILFVDTRYTGTVQLADGLFPAYVEAYGAVPSLNVAYMDAWKWKMEKALKARIRVTGECRKSTTTAVVCELPGTDPDGGILYAGGHHDTQAGTVGADDNAIGSASVLELARILSSVPHKATFRLISFGAEEQLSVGSCSYARKHRQEIRDRGLFMCNFDSCGSTMGWYEFTVNGTDELRSLIRRTYEKHGIYYTENTEPCPYTDQFPFAACTVPGIWLFRKNCASGIFFHHRVDNTADVIGYEDAAILIDASAEYLMEISEMSDAKAFCRIPDDLQKKIGGLFDSISGGF